MSRFHLLNSANRLGLSILQNQHGRISSSASYRATRVMHHHIIGNKGSSSPWLPGQLRGRPYSGQQQQQSCSDDALLHKLSITSIVLPLLASSMVLMYLNALTYTHEILMPYMHKVHDLHIDGKPVYSADEVSKARDTDGVVGSLRRSSRLSVFIATILTKVVALSDVFKKDPKS